MQMQKRKRLLLPKNYVVTQIIGALLLGIGVLTLFSNLRPAIISAAPLLASPLVGWFVTIAGFAIVFANGMRLVSYAKKQRQAIP